MVVQSFKSGMAAANAVEPRIEAAVKVAAVVKNFISISFAISKNIFEGES